MDAKELPAGEGLEASRKLAKDLLKAFKTGDGEALRRVGEHYQRALTWEELREGARRRLARRKEIRVYAGRRATAGRAIVRLRELAAVEDARRGDGAGGLAGCGV